MAERYQISHEIVSLKGGFFSLLHFWNFDAALCTHLLPGRRPHASNPDRACPGEPWDRQGADPISRDTLFSVPYSLFPKITIRFPTPKFLRADGEIIRRPEFHHLFNRLRNRINALSTFFDDSPVDADFRGLGAPAEKVHTLSAETEWIERCRTSSKTRQTADAALLRHAGEESQMAGAPTGVFPQRRSGQQHTQ